MCVVGKTTADLRMRFMAEALARSPPDAAIFHYEGPEHLWHDWLQLNDGGFLETVHPFSVIGKPVVSEHEAYVYALAQFSFWYLVFRMIYICAQITTAVEATQQRGYMRFPLPSVYCIVLITVNLKTRLYYTSTNKLLCGSVYSNGNPVVCSNRV